MKYGVIQKHSQGYPVRLLCRVMKLSKSSFYACKARPAQLITEQELQLYRITKALFNASRQSLGSREIAKKLSAEGFNVTRYKTMKVMAKLKLQAKQRVAYKITTKRKHSDSVAANLLNQNFKPVGQDQIWAGDIIYSKTAEGGVYLVITMDLYSRRIIGGATDKRMTTNLISRAMIMAYNLRRPAEGLVFHSDRGSQYTSKAYGELLLEYGIRTSMGGCECVLGQCRGQAILWCFKA